MILTVLLRSEQTVVLLTYAHGFEKECAWGQREDFPGAGLKGSLLWLLPLYRSSGNQHILVISEDFFVLYSHSASVSQGHHRHLDLSMHCRV